MTFKEKNSDVTKGEYPRVMFDLFRYFLFILDRFFPKTENLLLFPVKNEQGYRDNLRFFHVAASKHPEFDCVVLCYQKGEWSEGEVIFFHTMKGLLTWLRARMIVIHHGWADVPYSGSMDFHRRKLINLWHSISLKGIGFMSRNVDKRQFKKQFNTYKAVVCSSELDQLAVQASFRLPQKRIWPTGLPRNDMLIQKENDLPIDLQEESVWLQEKLQNQKMIMYMPTWRRKPEDSPEFSRKQCRKLSEMLKLNDAVFCVKRHPNTPSLIFDGMEFLDVSESPCREVGTLLRRADVLVTDYSSVWLDYLLLDRPVVSYCYDLESFINERGMLYNYGSIFPGKLNLTFESFLSELQKAMNGGPSKKQMQVKRLFHMYIDGKNSQRICERLLDEL